MVSPSSWESVVDWLSTFPGFECHVDQIDIPDEPILTIPPSALLNPLTLVAHPKCTIPSHLIPQRPTSHRAKRPRLNTTSPLNTTQLLTLHLALTREPGGRHPSPWKVYLKTIPQDFDWHPLVWAVKEDTRLERAPAAARAAVGEVRRRFNADREVLEQIVAEEEPFASQGVEISTDDYLWAWLIVNTRSVSLPLGFPGPTELYNHSLVPTLDLANHSSSPTIPRPRQIPFTPSTHPRSAHSGNTGPIGRRMGLNGHLIPGKIAYSFVAPTEGIKAGTEVRFEYHGLSNTDLWAEYGFAEAPTVPHPASSTLVSEDASSLPSPPTTPDSSPSSPVSSAWRHARYSGVDVTHLLDKRWTLTARQRQVLQTIGCLDKPTLHPWPVFEASHALLMRLRIIHLTRSEVAQGKLDAIEGFKVDFVSTENEQRVKKSLQEICQDMLDKAAAYRKLEKAKGMEMVDTLWWEVEDIARGCLAAYS